MESVSSIVELLIARVWRETVINTTKEIELSTLRSESHRTRNYIKYKLK